MDHQHLRQNSATGEACSFGKPTKHSLQTVTFVVSLGGLKVSSPGDLVQQPRAAVDHDCP